MTPNEPDHRYPITSGLAVLALVIFGFVAWQHRLDDHRHAAADATAVVPPPASGERWITDDILRTGMVRISSAIARILPAFERHDLGADDARALAAELQQHVNYLVNNCRLEPRADAALHALLTRLMTGAGVLTQDPASGTGMAQLLDALREYPEFFDHPGWRPLPDRPALAP